MRDALAYMAEQGMHLALLNSGIAGYYRRFGFSPVWPYYYFEVDSAEAAALESRFHLRAARADNIPQMAALYDRHWGGRVAFARHPESWLWRVTGDYFQVQVVEDDHGQVCGYVAGRDLGTEEVDVVVDTPEAATAVLAEWGRRYQEAGRAQIRWALPRTTRS
jgi:hypothetical protein